MADPTYADVGMLARTFPQYKGMAPDEAARRFLQEDELGKRIQAQYNFPLTASSTPSEGGTAFRSFASSALLGVPELIAGEEGSWVSPSKAEKKLNPASAMAGNIAGFFVPGLGAAKGLGWGGRALGRLATSLTSWRQRYTRTHSCFPMTAAAPLFPMTRAYFLP